MSSVGVQRRWWESLLHRGGAARGDLAGGLTAAVVLLAIEGSYGLVAFARLGPEQAQIGFVLGVCTAALASAVTAAVGGRGPLLSGSSAALALLVPALIGALVVDPRFLAADGQPNLPLLLAFIAFGVVLAGVMQVLLAASRLGGLVRYVPYPVHAGYMNGVAVLMVMAMLPHLLGLPLGQGAADWRNTQPLAPVVALVALVLAVRPPQWTRRVPAYLTGLLAATALHHLLALTPLAGALGPLFDPPRFEWPGVDAVAPLFEHLRRWSAARQDVVVGSIRSGGRVRIEFADGARRFHHRRADSPARGPRSRAARARCRQCCGRVHRWVGQCGRGWTQQGERGCGRHHRYVARFLRVSVCCSRSRSDCVTCASCRWRPSPAFSPRSHSRWSMHGPGVRPESCGDKHSNGACHVRWRRVTE